MQTKKSKADPNPTPILRKLLIASFFGLLIGLTAGLLGVGGGEFRLPVLIVLLGFPVAIAAAANLVIGILTVTVGLTTRLLTGVFDPRTISLIVAMSIGSIFGAYGGAALTGKVKEKYLKYAVGALLIGLGLKMIHGALVVEPADGVVVGYSMGMLAFGAVLGLLIGVVCGSLGVAGGELRIPPLIYLFGQPIKIAGTTSLAVSISAVAAGALKHKRMGHVSRSVIYTCIAMGIPSVVGAYVGATLVLVAGETFLKMLLGVVLLLAVVRIVKP
ncbi:MAG: sulfite exporter TauE/SafE family protein [Candidatus Hodarchaeaceae archaeon]|nr:sulfite exporter TauE/SafE family protein [Candidatus Hodarchaeaceae archaeon]